MTEHNAEVRAGCPRIESSYMTLRYVPDGGVSRTVCLGGGTAVDLDEHGRVVGIEAIGHAVGESDLLAVVWAIGPELNARTTGDG